MNITHRVKNSNNETCGFIVNNEYKTYYNVLNNIDLFDNVTVVDKNIIKSKQGKLAIISKKTVNRQLYQSIEHKNKLVRDIQKDLKSWKDNRNDMILYLVGARQIGKTTEILKFAYKNYEQIIYINLAAPEVIQNFEEAIINNDIYLGMIKFCRAMRLEEFENSSNTIIIIDEIQQSSNIYNSIRTLHSDLKCDIAVTGSYLGRTINSKYFKPAGNLWRIEMLPLSFTEFCSAFGCKDKLLNMDIHGKDSDETYNKMYQLYSIYIQIGGYPAVVSEYIKNENIEMCMSILAELIKTFTEESRSEVNDAISWLKYSNIIGSCDLYNQGKVSQLLSERRFYFMDCGIANCISKTTSVDNNTVTGMLTENFAYTELYRLYKQNCVKGDKPCCSVYNNNELDFMIVDKNDIKYGIEIKSSDDGKPASLLIYLKEKMIDKGYLAGKTRGGIRKDFYSIPIYTVGCRFPYD